MRLCRIGTEKAPEVAFYTEDRVVSMSAAARAFSRATGESLTLLHSPNLMDYLPPDGGGVYGLERIWEWLRENPRVDIAAAMPTAKAPILLPLPRVNKLLLLAGNYGAHIVERGYSPTERAETFPYVFMKPPSTTLIPTQRAVALPRSAPEGVDWEIELGIVIGRKARRVSEADAKNCIAGYTIVNDISHRRFRPNPGRRKRERDTFFDWQHGKWFDTFCPCGPCILTATSIEDPQCLDMTLTLNGEVRQKGNTGQMIFPIDAIVSFISHMVTLEPGDIIATGTPAGVGAATGLFLRPGDLMTAHISHIGTLTTPVEMEH